MLGSLIDDVLDMSRLESGAFEVNTSSFSIAELLKEVEELFAMTVEQKGIELCVSHCNSLLDAVGYSDKKRITQVLLNLISNAIKFTKQGSISVTANVTEEGIVEFGVRDSGVGITAEAQKNLFKMFGKARENNSMN